MTDVHDKKTRSYNMSRIRSKGTKPEMLVRKYLFSKGFRFRLNVKNLPGKPDIVLAKYKTAIFIHGCFWHGHQNCKYFVVPKTRAEWWIDKITHNKILDVENLAKLKAKGWNVLVIFECELMKDKIESTLSEITTNLY
jgi:DNA mismatch endonuclease (patch repair protein)